MLSILQKRRSIRSFLNKKIPKEIIEKFKEALLRSPASKSSNPWEFIFIEDSSMLNKLSISKPNGATFLKNAKLGIVICGDETKSDVWVEDCAISSIILQLTVESEGLKSCWVQIRKRFYDDRTTSEEYVKKLLNISENIRVLSIVGIGYSEVKKEGHKIESLDFSKIHIEKF